MTLDELNQHFVLRKRLDRAKEMLASFRAAAHPGAQTLTGMPHSPGVSDKVGDLAIEIWDLQSRIDHLESKCAEEKKKLEKYIGGIKDDQTRMIFRLRFIHCMTWLQVAEAVGGRNTASSVRAICYRHLKSCSGANTRER